MLFRASFIISYIIFAINVAALINTESGNLIDKMGFFISACIYMLTRKIDHVIATLFLSIFIIIFILALLTDYDQFRWGIFINSLNQIFIVYALISAYPTKKDQEIILKSAAFLPILCTVLGFIYQAIGIQAAFGLEFATGLYRMQGSLIPAYLSGIAMCGTFAALQVYLANNQKYIYIFAANSLVLLASGGRAALAVTILTCGATILFKRGLQLSKKVILFFCVLFGSIPIIFLFWDRLLTRFTTSGANGRDIIWDYLLEVSKDYPWTGIGFGHQFFAVPREIDIIVGSSAAHNDFIRLTLELGYIGAILFYIILTGSILRIFLRSRMPGDFVLIISYLGFLLLSRTDNALASPSYFPLVFLALISGITYRESQKTPMSTPWTPYHRLHHEKYKRAGWSD